MIVNIGQKMTDSMHDILLVHVPYMFNTNPPMAAPLLKACLAQHGINAKALDLNIDFINSKVSADSIIVWMQHPISKPNITEWENYKDWMHQHAKAIAQTDIPYVGISVFTKDSQRAAEDLAYFIKQENPAKKIVLGGQGTNVYQSQWKSNWYQLMLDSGIVDAVVLGEGEKAIVDVIKNNLTGVVQIPQLTNNELDLVPLPDFSDYNLSSYMHDLDDEYFAIPITASKGCVRKCTFCDIGKHWPKFRYRNGTRVAEELIHYYKNYNFKYFRFTDSLINGNTKELRAMNTKLAEEIPYTIKYRGQLICRPQNQMPKNDFKLMAKGGAYRVQIGIESGSEAVRDHMGKKFSNADIDYCTYQLFDNNIKQSWFIFVGYPTETEQDYEDTLNLIKKYKHLVKDQMLQIIPTGVFQLLDGTPSSSPKMLEELDIEQHIVNGYQTYNWVSNKYPENTFNVRAERFKRLVELCKELGFISDFENMVDGHMKMINNQGGIHG